MLYEVITNHALQIFLIGYTQVNVHATYGELGNIGYFRANQGLIGDSDQQVIEGFQFYREQIDGIHYAEFIANTN